MASEQPTDPTMTRKDATIFTVTDAGQAIGYYLAEDLIKTWQEDFTDGDTGEVVTVNRQEIIKRRGEIITPELASSLNFYIQAGDIETIRVSDQRRQAKSARNISAGTTIQIPARYVVAFKPSKDFNIDQNIAL